MPADNLTKRPKRSPGGLQCEGWPEGRQSFASCEYRVAYVIEDRDGAKHNACDWHLSQVTRRYAGPDHCLMVP